MSLITHIVALKYTSATSDAEKHLVASAFLALQDQCHFQGKPYITVTGGSNHSPENLAKGYEHAFVITFGSVEARDYYVAEDPAHARFKELAGQHVADAFVFDFSGGTF